MKPSLLCHLVLNVNAYNCTYISREVVPNSSEEDEQMSDEFPPPSPSKSGIISCNFIVGGQEHLQLATDSQKGPVIACANL